MALSIELTEEEKTLVKKCAINGNSLNEIFKAFFEKIEDEYDAAIGEIAYKKHLKNPKTYSLREIMEEEDE